MTENLSILNHTVPDSLCKCNTGSFQAYIYQVSEKLKRLRDLLSHDPFRCYLKHMQTLHLCNENKNTQLLLL